MHRKTFGGRTALRPAGSQTAPLATMGCFVPMGEVEENGRERRRWNGRGQKEGEKEGVERKGRG